MKRLTPSVVALLFWTAAAFAQQGTANLRGRHELRG